MSTYKFHYFCLTGRGEVCRYLFKLAEQPFEDIRHNIEEWPVQKADAPFEALPYLECDGEVICQSHAIERLLAKRFNRYGDTDIEQAKSDMIVDCCDDILKAFFINTSGDGRVEKRKKWIDEVLPNYMEKLEKFATTSGFIPNRSKMLPDLVFLSMIEVIEMFAFTDGGKINLEKFPKLLEITTTVLADPKIAAWIKERPANVIPDA